MVPGACGELFQGTLDGIPCLVSCPINLYSEVEVCVKAGEGQTDTPMEMPKTHSAIELFLAQQKITDVKVTIRRVSCLPLARGYASSTADILAAIYGLAALLDLSISPEAATRLAIQVEPTDSLAWKELTLLAHRDGQLMRPICLPADLCVLVLDWGGEIDTLSFNRLDHSAALRELAAVHADAYAQLQEGLLNSDRERIGRAATLSAHAHQQILQKDCLEPVIKLAERFKAYGVCVAHSGTIMGILLEPGEAPAVVESLIPHLPGRPRTLLADVVPGGPRFMEH
jgi:L-threonine kinase